MRVTGTREQQTRRRLLDTVAARVVRSREAGRERAKLASDNLQTPKVTTPPETVLPERGARWKGSRRLARVLLAQLYEYNIDAARETCYTIIAMMDAVQRGHSDG